VRRCLDGVVTVCGELARERARRRLDGCMTVRGLRARARARTAARAAADGRVTVGRCALCALVANSAPRNRQNFSFFIRKGPSMD
jgi:hypothetical protein